MIVQEALNRLNILPSDSCVEVSDFVGAKNYPCCVRRENGKVIVDIVTPTMAALEQPNLIPLSAVELRQKLETANSPEKEIVFSNYSGQVFDATCVRLENDSACFDIDGVA